MLRAIMRQLLVGPHSFSCAGVLVPIEVNPGLRVAFQLTAALQTALTDGEGIMKCLQWNGHGSMRPCVGHCKCFQEGERHCRCLTCSPNTGGGEQEQNWCDCECKKDDPPSAALPLIT